VKSKGLCRKRATSSHVTRHTSHVTRQTSHVTRHTSHVTRHVTCHTSHLTPHTSHLTRHTSLVTRHSSLVTRHSSLVTRHTSHVTRHKFHIDRHASHTSLRGDALTAINGTSLLDIRGEGEAPDAVPSSGEREGGRRLHHESLRSLIVGPEGQGFGVVGLFLSFVLWLGAVIRRG
jgi:hypothetical protein